MFPSRLASLTICACMNILLPLPCMHLAPRHLISSVAIWTCCIIDCLLNFRLAPMLYAALERPSYITYDIVLWLPLAWLPPQFNPSTSRRATMRTLRGIRYRRTPPFRSLLMTREPPLTAHGRTALQSRGPSASMPGAQESAGVLQGLGLAGGAGHSGICRAVSAIMPQNISGWCDVR